MVKKSLQKQIEEHAYESLEQIADELKINIPFYPEVYYIGGNFFFEILGLPEKYRDTFEGVKKEKSSIYLCKPRIILIGRNNLEDIAEETGHFLHFANSKLQYDKRRNLDKFSLNVIIEMFGFFCSKLITPNRKNLFSKYPDAINENAILDQIEKSGFNKTTFLIYQQGYGLGEKLFDAYLSGLISKREIRKLFLNDFLKPNETFSTFLRLKEKGFY